MSRESIEVRECDRCSHRVELREFGREFDWGEAWAKAPALDPVNQPGRRIGDHTRPADLCPTCVGELFDWWKSAPDKSQQRLPTPGIGMTGSRRKQLLALIEMELRDQICASIDAVREQPTSILSGEVVPGAMAGVEDRAETLLNVLLDGIA